MATVAGSDIDKQSESDLSLAKRTKVPALDKTQPRRLQKEGIECGLSDFSVT